METKMANTFTYKINGEEFVRKEGELIIQHDDEEYSTINKLISTLKEIKLELGESADHSLIEKLKEAINMGKDVRDEISSFISYKDDFLHSR